MAIGARMKGVSGDRGAPWKRRHTAQAGVRRDTGPVTATATPDDLARPPYRATWFGRNGRCMVVGSSG